jgi:hypothetical protein
VGDELGGELVEARVVHGERVERGWSGVRRRRDRVIRARDDGTRVATVRVLSNAEWEWGERDGGEQGDCAGRGTGFEGRRTNSCL